VVTLGLLGCGDGPADLTTITDLRLVAAIAEPPEVAAGERWTLTAVIADPFGDGADTWLWQCGPSELPCEVASGPLVGDTVSGSFLAGLPIPVWIVSCRPGICDAPTEEQLRDPPGWLATLPIAGVAAGTKTVALAEGPERNQNPQITTSPAAVFEAATLDAVPLRFVTTGGFSVSGLATAGGFARVSEVLPDSGDFTLDWLVPDTTGEARLWIVVDDGRSGTAVWRGTATVR
jgi:hypothetical protein